LPTNAQVTLDPHSNRIGGEAMQQPTGSVYLDAPARPSRLPTKPPRGARSVISGGAIIIGVIAMTLVAVVTGLRMLVLDEAAAMTAFEQTLDDPAAREELRTEVARGIETQLLGEELVAIAAAFGLDVSLEAEVVSAAIVDDDAVRAELRTLAEDLHRRTFETGDPTAVDLTPLTAAVMRVLEVESPRLASVVPADAVLWTVDPGSFPDLTVVSDLSARVRGFALLASLLAPLGLAVHPHRHRAAGWMGRWVLGVGLVSGITALALPYLIGAVTGFRAAEIAVRVLSLKLLAPAALSGIVGVGLVSFSAVLRKRDRRRVAEEGAAAMLGYDEPPLFTPITGPTFDLESRGLVDAGRPLTNI
jgi:hypothetical protein